MRRKQFWKDLAVVTLATAMIGVTTCCYVRASLGGDSVRYFWRG